MSHRPDAAARPWPSGRPPPNRRHEPNWTTGAKDAVGTHAGSASRVWFTLARGTLTEVYYPRTDQANTRDLRFVVTRTGAPPFDEMRDARTHLERVAPSVPLHRIRQSSADDALVLHKTIVTDGQRPVVLLRARLEVRRPRAGNVRVFVLLAPHIGNRGDNNDGWIGTYKGLPILTARRASTALALACSVPMPVATCTYAGPDDAWHDLRARSELTALSPHAFDGNLLLAAEIGAGPGEEFVLALGFGDRSEDAAEAARASLLHPFEDIVNRYVAGWTERQSACRPLSPPDDDVADAHRLSVAVVHVHQDKDRPGGFIASLGIPWGMVRGDDDRGAYHLVWPRDLTEMAGALLAAGLGQSSHQALAYLMSTQESPGHWPQNMWLDGRGYWHGVQLDEAALPILLAAMLERHGCIAGLDPWPMVRRAVGYIVRHGPATPEGRWEEHIGFSPFTLAVEIAALVQAAALAARAGESELARYLASTAAAWNADVERWTFTRDTPVTRRLNISGYYARTGVTARNEVQRAVATDALALVRFGVRDANDPRVRDSVLAIDAVLKIDTACGPVWHRFEDDHYGERADGSPYVDDGIGRGWPLLVGERAHYELARGDRDAALALRRAMLAQAGRGGLFPEQIWDAPDIPSCHLVNGRPTGSAMPLAWAHAEYIKLCRSLDDGRVFDTPPDVRAVLAREPPIVVWRRDLARRDLPAGSILRLDFHDARAIRWSVAGRSGRTVACTARSGLGTHFVDLPTADLHPGDTLRIRDDRSDDLDVQLRVGDAAETQ